MKVSRWLVGFMVLNLTVTLSWVIFSSIGLQHYSLPEYVPFHWNLLGDVDGFAPRWALAVLAALPLIIYFLLFLMPRVDLQTDEEEGFKGVFGLLTAAFVVFFVAMQWGVTSAALGLPLNIVSLIKITAGLLILIAGILTGRLPYRFPLGIRTPWTLASETVWHRTHRMGAWVFFFLGIWVLMLLFVPGILDYILFFSGVLGAVGYLFYYSYREHRKG